jgi:hypothetical protein
MSCSYVMQKLTPPRGGRRECRLCTFRGRRARQPQVAAADALTGLQGVGGGVVTADASRVADLEASELAGTAAIATATGSAGSRGFTARDCTCGRRCSPSLHLPLPGRLAQLGERRLDKAEVAGSSPASPISRTSLPTSSPPTRDRVRAGQSRRRRSFRQSMPQAGSRTAPRRSEDLGQPYLGGAVGIDQRFQRHLIRWQRQHRCIVQEHQKAVHRAQERPVV